MNSLSAEATSRGRRGPGLLESVGWTVGYLVAQVLAAAFLVIVLVVFAFDGWPADISIVTDVLSKMDAADITWLTVYVTGGATLGALFVIVPAVCLRMRPTPRITLGTQLPDRRQMVLLTGVVLPLGILAVEVYRAATLAWESLRGQLIDALPVLAEFGQTDTMDLIQSQTAYTSYPLLLVIVGVGPAIGEELVFRGLIGRGLIERLGVVWGILLTSLLFGIAHGTPAHAIATLPLGIFLHITYLTTRTIWAPIFVHFMNNALSVTMMKYGMGELTAHVSVSWVLLSSAAVYVTTISVLLWHRREGHTAGWSSPPLMMETGGEAFALASPRWLTVMTTAGVLTFTWTFVAAAVAGGAL